MFFGASEWILCPSVILKFSMQRESPAHVTVNPTAVTQRGESLARHRKCNLTQYFSHLQGALKVYICATGCCVSRHDLLVLQWHLVGPCWIFQVWYNSDEPINLYMIVYFLPFFHYPSGGDESQVALAIVLASSKDCGVYGCSISNEYGTDTTDFLLSEDSKCLKTSSVKSTSYVFNCALISLLSSVLQFCLRYY